MEIIFFILMLSVILIIVIISKKGKEIKNKVDNIFSENNAKEMISGELIEGINAVNNGTFCYITANDEGITIVEYNSNQKFNIKIDKITNFQILTNTQITEKQEFKNKNTIGRAVAGGLLFGGIGAIVGAQSGGLKAVKRKELKIEYYLIINYISKDNNIEIISFKVDKSKHSIVEYINNMISKNIVVEL